MITLLLMQPVLSEGEGGAIEAVISAVLERIRKLDGNACHEETIGDYATYLNSLVNISSTKPLCSYIMVDTQYYLAPVMENYFLNTAYNYERDKIRAGICLELQNALLKFRRPQLWFQVSLKGGARKHLWNHELGQLFPTLRDLNRLTIKCESSERLDPRISSI